MIKIYGQQTAGDEASVCLLADLCFWDCVTVATLSFKSALFTDIFSLLAVTCSP